MGRITNWKIHIITMTQKKRALLTACYPNAFSALISGQVIEDASGRWQHGDSMRSSWITSMDSNAKIVCTINSTYALDGPGKCIVSDTAPITLEDAAKQTVPERQNEEYCENTIEVALQLLAKMSN